MLHSGLFSHRRHTYKNCHPKLGTKDRYRFTLRIGISIYQATGCSLDPHLHDNPLRLASCINMHSFLGPSRSMDPYLSNTIVSRCRHISIDPLSIRTTQDMQLVSIHIRRDLGQRCNLAPELSNMLGLKGMECIRRSNRPKHIQVNNFQLVDDNSIHSHLHHYRRVGLGLRNQFESNRTCTRSLHHPKHSQCHNFVGTCTCIHNPYSPSIVICCIAFQTLCTRISN